MEMQIGFSNLLPCLLCQSTHKSVGERKRQGVKELKIRWGFLTFTRDLWKIIKDRQNVAFIIETFHWEFSLLCNNFFKQIYSSFIIPNQRYVSIPKGRYKYIKISLILSKLFIKSKEEESQAGYPYKFFFDFDQP